MKVFQIITVVCALTCDVCKGVDSYYEYPDEVQKDSDDQSTTDRWCQLSCEDKQNVACPEEKCKLKEPCTSVTLDVKKILDKHNELRNKFALGNEPASGGMKVANMMGLKWDDDLAFTASCNLAECGEVKEDACHRTPKFKTVGQNQWSSTGAVDDDCIEKVAGVIQGWYNEVEQTTPETVQVDADSYTGLTKTKHFYQVTWATTTHVGCAMTEIGDEMGRKCMMTCNYGPGSVKKGRAYHEGTPCSECPDPFCNDYGLCFISEQQTRSNNRGTCLRPSTDVFIKFLFFVHRWFV